MLDGLADPTGCEYDGELLGVLLLDGVLLEEPLLVLEELSVLEAGGVEVVGGGRGVGMFGSMSSMFEDNSLNYYCMTCGTKHREAACPKCGSKMKRVGS